MTKSRIRRLRSATTAPFQRVLDRRIRYVMLNHYLTYGDASRLTIDPTAIVNNALFNLSSGRISVGPYAFFSHSVSLITGVHDYSQVNLERQLASVKEGRDITIGQGAWIACNVTILGPCTIGEHAVVAAGSVVTADVPAKTLVGGIPARVLRAIAILGAE